MEVAYNITSTDSVILDTEEYTPCSNLFLHIIQTCSEHIKIVYGTGFVISLIGIALNFCAFDVSRSVTQQTSSTVWMTHLAVWDSASLVYNGVVEMGLSFFDIKLTQENEIVCKGFGVIWWATGINAGAHLVALAVDRAIKMRHATWYHKNMKDENIKKISVGLTCFHFVIVLPNALFYRIEDNYCRMRSEFIMLLRVYQLAGFAIFSLGHFMAIMVSNGFFVLQLWRKRKPTSSVNSVSRADPKAETNYAPENQKQTAKNEVSTPVAEKIFDSTDVIYCGPNSFICTNFAQKTTTDKGAPEDSNLIKEENNSAKNKRKTLKRISNTTTEKDSRSGVQETENEFPNSATSQDESHLQNTSNNLESTSIKKKDKTEHKTPDARRKTVHKFGNETVPGNNKDAIKDCNLESDSVFSNVISRGNESLGNADAPGTSGWTSLEVPKTTNAAPNSQLNSITVYTTERKTPQKNMLNSRPAQANLPGIEVDPPTKCPDPSKAVRRVSRTIKKAVSHLSREDWTALTTIVFVCIWYLWSSLLSTVLLHVTDWMDESTITTPEREFLRSVSRLLMIVNNSVNFIFYYRAQSVKDTAKRRWFYWTSCCG